MKYCLDCGFVGEPEQHDPGKVSTEIVLWLFLVVPGIIYSVWRSLSRYQGCAKCGGQHLVKSDSPFARAALLKLSPTPSRELWFCAACGQPIFSAGAFCEKCEPRVRTTTEAVAQLQN